MQNWNWNKVAQVGTAAVSFVTLAMLFVGFFIGIVTDSDLNRVEASLEEDIAEVEASIAESEARLAAAIESLRNEIRASNTRIDRHLERHGE